jgi:hypothetical protein
MGCAGKESAWLEGERGDLEALERKLEGLIGLIVCGVRAAWLRGRREGVDNRKADVDVEIATALQALVPPRRHAKVATFCRDRTAA